MVDGLNINKTAKVEIEVYRVRGEGIPGDKRAFCEEDFPRIERLCEEVEIGRKDIVAVGTSLKF